MSGLPHPNTMIALAQQRQAELHDQAARERQSRLASPGAQSRRPELSAVAMAVGAALLLAAGTALR